MGRYVCHARGPHGQRTSTIRRYRAASWGELRFKGRSAGVAAGETRGCGYDGRLLRYVWRWQLERALGLGGLHSRDVSELGNDIRVRSPSDHTKRCEDLGRSQPSAGGAADDAIEIAERVVVDEEGDADRLPRGPFSLSHVPIRVLCPSTRHRGRAACRSTRSPPIELLPKQAGDGGGDRLAGVVLVEREPR